jgi:hypothetical protein
VGPRAAQAARLIPSRISRRIFHESKVGGCTLEERLPARQTDLAKKMALREAGDSQKTHIFPGEPRMAKRKRSHRTPQARHGRKSPKSRHDRRKCLQIRNANRRKTRDAKVPLVGSMKVMAKQMSELLDARIAFRLPIILAGAMLAGSRRTASRWFRSAGVADDWDRFYNLLVSIGRNTTPLAFPLLSTIVGRFDPGEGMYWTLALDDSPTKRYRNR